MSQLTKQQNGVWPDNKPQERIKGKEVSPIGVTFKTGAILNELPATKDINYPSMAEKGFKDNTEVKI